MISKYSEGYDTVKLGVTRDNHDIHAPRPTEWIDADLFGPTMRRPYLL